MADPVDILDSLTFKRIVERTSVATGKRQMTSAVWKQLLTNETVAKYLIPGTLLVGGGLLFYTGYCLGARKGRSQKQPKSKAAAETEAIQISCCTPGTPLSRVNSEVSVASPESIEGSEKGSPVGDAYRCALIVRKDCRLARSKVIIHCCRAFLAEFKKVYKQKDPDLKRWEQDGMTVVVLRAENEQELITLKARSADVGVNSHTFSTKQSDGSSFKTVMALGPSKSHLIQDLTAHLLRL